MATQVTVNGVPVEQLIKEQDAQEISEVRQSENRVKVYKAKRSSSWRVPRSKGVPVRNWNLPDYQNWAREPLIIVSGQVYPRVLKGDFAPSGVSIIGALEYDPKKEAVKCHECGEWKTTLWAGGPGGHLKGHGLTSKEYKAKHGLSVSTALCAPKVSRSISAGQKASLRCGHRLFYGPNRPRGGNKVGNSRASSERLNSQEYCPLQLSGKVCRLAQELGRAPTVKEFRERYGEARRAIDGIFGSYNALVKHVGLTPKKAHHYCREELLERIRKFVEVCQRTPAAIEFGKKGLLPSWSLYKREFGSWQNAVGLCV